MRSRYLALVVGLIAGAITFVSMPAIGQSGAVLFNGTANQVLGINSRGTAPEAKTLEGDDVMISVTHSANLISLTGTPRRLSGTTPVVVDADGGSVTLDYGELFVIGDTATATLPTAVGHEGEEVLIKNNNGAANSVTMASTSSQTIDGAAAGSTTVAAGAKLGFVSDGANWVSY